MNSSIKLIPFEPWHYAIITPQKSQVSVQTALAESWGNVEAFAEYLKQGSVSSWSAECNGIILAVGGIYKINSHSGECWMLFDELFFHLPPSQRAVAMIRVKKELLKHSLKRLQAVTTCDFEAGKQMLERLGFNLEAPVLKYYGLDGADCSLYSITR